MMGPLSILFRGPLSSCNYDCEYCPFAKRVSRRQELGRDRAALSRFIAWALGADRPLSILFTPWGEALIRRHYQRSLVVLSQAAHVDRVAIQTNLTASLDFLDEADLNTVALWTTFHPSQTTVDAFVARCHRLLEKGVRFSVGVVGLRENIEVAQELRAALPQDVYVWVNAYKSSGPHYYQAGEARAFSRIDPLFPLNNTRHRSHGEPCATGDTVISVDGEGNVRRCHFVSEVIGNLYETELETMLRPRPCPNATCGCHIGYVHLEKLQLKARFGAGLLERIPRGVPVLRTEEKVTPHG